MLHDQVQTHDDSEQGRGAGDNQGEVVEVERSDDVDLGCREDCGEKTTTSATVLGRSARNLGRNRTPQILQRRIARQVHGGHFSSASCLRFFIPLPLFVAISSGARGVMAAGSCALAKLVSGCGVVLGDLQRSCVWPPASRPSTEENTGPNRRSSQDLACVRDGGVRSISRVVAGAIPETGQSGGAEACLWSMERSTAETPKKEKKRVNECREMPARALEAESASPGRE